MALKRFKAIVMLHEYLLAERKGVLALCATKLNVLADSKSSSSEMEKGLPVFYDELIEVLRADKYQSDATSDKKSENIHVASATRRGKESLRLGYTVSQVVHGYGALCQAITQYVGENGAQPIYAREFSRLNFCLDVAVAEAVTEFNSQELNKKTRDEVQRLGFLAHELRNALNTAVMAHRMIETGRVGIGGNTNKVLKDAHERMREIIDRSLSEVRLKSEPTVELQRFRVFHLVSEVETTASHAANEKSIQLHVEASHELEVLVDPHLFASALSNIVQNAIKFTKQEGIVWIRCRSNAGRVLIEVEDQCGGLPEGKIEELFKPYTQIGSDKSGLGLGLTIARRAVEQCGGKLTARDIAGSGCIFSIDLPQAS